MNQRYNTYEARLVARKLCKRCGPDYDQVFTPVVHYDIVQLLRLRRRLQSPIARPRAGQMHNEADGPHQRSLVEVMTMRRISWLPDPFWTSSSVEGLELDCVPDRLPAASTTTFNGLPARRFQHQLRWVTPSPPPCWTPSHFRNPFHSSSDGIFKTTPTP
jgi:hypothetical protein